MDAHAEQRRGLVATAASFLIWGIVPIYWKAVGTISPNEMIGWRVVWALPFTGLLLVMFGGAREVLTALRSRRLLGILALSATLESAHEYL